MAFSTSSKLVATRGAVLQQGVDFEAPWGAVTFPALPASFRSCAAALLRDVYEGR
ncbi:MAG: hypothetical protein P9L99_07540 [Candidatus Lernaella stagnicola]|nr:hypothetical protein [Candidatus Lernaella stagnicola]